MDSYALAFKLARRIVADGLLSQYVQERYASFDSGFGRGIEAQEIGFVELERIAHKLGEPTPRSGRQELLENILNQYLTS